MLSVGLRGAPLWGRPHRDHDQGLPCISETYGLLCETADLRRA